MNARIVSENPAELEIEALAVAVRQAEDETWADERLDVWTDGLASELLSSKEFSGKGGETALIHRPAGLKAPRLLLLGLGEKPSAAEIRTAFSLAVRRLKGSGVKRLAVAFSHVDSAVQAAVEGVGLGNYEPDVYKSEGRAEGAVDEVLVAAPDGVEEAARGIASADGQNYARTLANEPGNRLTPTVLAERARELAAETGLGIEVLDREALEELGCGALLGVAQGSVEPPVMIVLRYEPEGAPSADVHLGLVGKAVTFDTGGISIKPAADMDQMKYDMAGGAAMLGTMKAVAALKPSVPVTAVIPSVENMPSGSAQRPGDVVTSLSGKTVEVLNTDAEGRLILADAITYAQRLGCNRLVDAATLTGSIVVALGHERGGVFSNDEDWQRSLLDSAERAGEKMWPMPMDDDYKEQLKSPIADLANIGTRWGGSITAAIFLKAFADPTPWVHLDIAGTAWLDAPKPHMPKGPTGVAVRTLVDLAMGL